jgi:hypothetical protein
MVVSNTVALTSALANTAVGRIVLAPGTYILDAELSITRSVVLEAAVAGSVVLDAQASSASQRRVLSINPGSLGVVQLIGLNITGGYVYGSGGGGVFVSSGTVTITSSSIYENTAFPYGVRAHFETSHRPDGIVADALGLPRLTLAQLRLTLRSTTVGTCRRDLQCFPSPPWETHVLLVVCRAAVSTSLPARSR